MKFGMKQVKYAVEDGIRKLKECLRICEQPDGPYMYGEVLERSRKGWRPNGVEGNIGRDIFCSGNGV